MVSGIQLRLKRSWPLEETGQEIWAIQVDVIVYCIKFEQQKTDGIELDLGWQFSPSWVCISQLIPMLLCDNIQKQTLFNLCSQIVRWQLFYILNRNCFWPKFWKVKAVQYLNIFLNNRDKYFINIWKNTFFKERFNIFKYSRKKVEISFIIQQAYQIFRKPK